MEGVLAAIHGDEAEIDVHGKRLRARVGDVRVLTEAQAAAGAHKAVPQARVSVNVQLQPRGDGLLSDLNVIGCTVEEALSRTERFLDQMVHGRSARSADHPRLRHRAAAPGHRASTSATTRWSRATTPRRRSREAAG